ncbi:MAG TPA: NAD(P)-dependent alcohol dehydrogenase [Candidatus Limnocylindrales bacterium]|nr:NAD(P)-dependent alcohol dehydrogenase [Candidatus Limnocylindrales bacterium]
MTQTGYGDPARVLRIDELAKPQAGEGQVLVRVVASSVNSGDWRRVLADPFIVRLVEGVRRPKPHMLGGDVSGVVEEVGRGVTNLEPGDEVYGVRTGAFAEYVAAKHVVRKPASLSFEEAAATPIAGLTALQALRDKGGLQAGQSVLISGAGGGVGTFAVQLAKAMGATVAATTRTDKIELLRSLGADRVFDYTREDFVSAPDRYDLVVDIGGRRSLRALRSVLRPGGAFVQVGAARGGSGVIGRMISGLIRSRLLRQRVVVFISKASTADFETLRELIDAGRIRPVVERTYALDEIADAIAYAATEQAAGKIVIRVARDQPAGGGTPGE